MPVNKISQLQSGVVYYKQSGSYSIVGDINTIPNNSLLYIRDNNTVMIYRASKLYPTQPINVGFGVTNPWSDNGTQADIDKIISQSKKLAAIIQKGIRAAKKMQRADEKAFMRTVYEGFAIMAITAITVGVAAYLAPAASATASGGITTSAQLTTGAQYAGIAGAPSVAGAPLTSTLFASGGSVLPSAGSGVGLITTGGGTILPAATTAIQGTISTISKIGKVLGITSGKTALTIATTAGKFVLTQQQQKQAQEQMQKYQQAIAQNNTQKAEAIKEYYQKQLDQWENQLANSDTGSVVGATWGQDSLDLQKYLPYLIVGMIVFFIIKK